MNRKYRPLGVTSILSLSPGDEYLKINPPYLSTLSLDEKFLEDCAPNLRPDNAVQYPGDFIVTLEQGRIYQLDDANMAVVDKNNILVDELSFQWVREKGQLPGRENEIFTNRFFTPPRKVKGTVFSLLSGGGAIHYYYHWVLDSIPKLHLLQQLGLFDKVDYFLVPFTGYKFQKAYLKHFGIDDAKIINGVDYTHIQADQLVLSSYTRINEHLPRWVCDFLHESFIPPGSTGVRDKMVYIARGDAIRNRKVRNEELLIEEVERLGFEVHYLSHLTVEEQARLFNSAKLVVASHGGGLTNLVYCEPGTKVLEFFPDNYVNHLFYDLSTKRQLQYHYLICPAEMSDQDELQAETNLIADVEAIKQKIIELLKD